MKYFIKAIIITSYLFTSSSAIADTPTETFGNCLIDNLNGKERKEMVKWLFFSIASHPDLNSYLNATQNDIIDSDKYIGNLITRLLSDDCPNEMKSAAKADPQAIRKAFGLVGRVAMQELMRDQTVNTTITNYVKYTNQEKINEALGE